MDSPLSPLAKAGVTAIVVWICVATIFTTFYIGEYLARDPEEKSKWKLGKTVIQCIGQILGTSVAVTGFLVFLSTLRSEAFKNFWEIFTPIRRKSRNEESEKKNNLQFFKNMFCPGDNHKGGIVLEKSRIVAEKQVLRPHEFTDDSDIEIRSSTDLSSDVTTVNEKAINLK